MAPYYDDGHGIRLYCGDCTTALHKLDPKRVDLVLTDPPYGISIQTNGESAKRSKLAHAHDYTAVVGDDAPFDPALLLKFRRLILFGANNYADKLPPPAEAISYGTKWRV